MTENFEACRGFTLAAEGGFTNNPHDNGGATNFGITLQTLQAWRGHPVIVDDVRNMTEAEALQIYKANYYNPIKGDQLPISLAVVAFDAAVNSGCRQSILFLQRALNVTADGYIGSGTINAANSCNANETAHKTINERLKFMQGLASWQYFGKGWTNRLNQLSIYIDSL